MIKRLVTLIAVLALLAVPTTGVAFAQGGSGGNSNQGGNNGNPAPIGHNEGRNEQR